MPKILIVEDDPAVRDVVEYALSREGMETEAVASGEAATARLFSDAAFDLLILDVMLPDTDGVTLCRELRSAPCASRDVPVIMLTARDDETSVVVGLEVGADDYVTKPFSPRQLVSRVRAHLRRQHLSSRAGDSRAAEARVPGPHDRPAAPGGVGRKQAD
jgi:DNA-binding response OmpR family regulator